jgi:REP element-mobilizing transposase RayT
MHRNSQKRIYLNNYGYFVTTIAYKRFPYFRENIFCKLFTEELLLSQKLKTFELYGYIIMPDHIHLLIRPNGEYNISKIMQFIKRHFSRDVNSVITGEGDTRECRPRGGKYEFLREKIGIHDSTVEKCRKKFIKKYGRNQIQFPPFKWQKSFRDHVIRNERDLHNHLVYMQNNQQKYNLTPK